MASRLDGVVAAGTVLSHTDPADGMVWVRGATPSPSSSPSAAAPAGSPTQWNSKKPDA